MLAPAEESSLKLLVGTQACQVDCRPTIGQRSRSSAIPPETRDGTRHQAAVISPVETDPRATLPRLILQVSRLIELLVVVDAEDHWRAGSSSCTAELGLEEPRCNTGEDHQRGESMEIWHAHTPRKSRNLGSVPRNREKDGGVAEYAEIVCIVGVLPDVLAGEDQIPAKRLLETGVELITPAGS